MNEQVILEEDYDENYVPMEEEIHEYARVIGLDPLKEPNLLWIAREGINAPLPNHWKPCQDTNGDIYYFNFETGDSIWDHPCDEFYRNMVAEERQKQLTKPAVQPSAQQKKKKEKGTKKKKAKGEKVGEVPTLQSSLKPLNPLKTIDAPMGLQSPLGTLAPLKGLGSTKMMTSSPVSPGIPTQPDVMQLTGSSLASTSDIGRINLEKMKTQDLEQSALEYHISEEEEVEEESGGDDIAKMNISSNSNDLDSEDGKFTPEANLLEVEKLAPIEKQKSVKFDDSLQLHEPEKKEISAPGKAAAKAAEQRLYGKSDLKIDSDTSESEISSTNEKLTEEDSTKLKLEKKLRLSDYREKIEKDIDIEKMRLEEEKLQNLERLQKHFKVDLEREEAKFKCEQSEKIENMKERLENETNAEIRRLKKASDERILKNKAEIDTKEKSVKESHLQEEVEAEIEEENERLLNHKKKRLQELHRNHDDELKTTEQELRLKLQKEKNEQLETIKRLHEESLNSLKLRLDLEQKDKEKQLVLSEGKAISIGEEYDQSLRNILGDKSQSLYEEHEKDVHEILKLHNERMKKLRESNEATYQREIEVLKKQMKNDLELQMTKLASENDSKLERMKRQYKTSLAELENDKNMVNWKQQQLQSRREKMESLERDLVEKDVHREAAKGREEVKDFLSFKSELEEEVHKLKLQQEALQRNVQNLRSGNLKASHDRLQLEDLGSSQGNVGPSASRKSSDSSSAPEYPKAAWQKEEDGILKAREFLHKQQQSMKGVSWYDSINNSEKQASSSTTRNLLHDIKNSLAHEAMQLQADPTMNAKENDSSYAKWFENERYLQAEAENAKRNRPVSAPHQLGIAEQSAGNVVDYLKAVDGKLNHIMHKMEEKERTPVSIPMPSYVPVRQNSFIPDLVENELIHNYSKYFGLGSTPKQPTFFEKNPVPYWRYVSGRELMETGGRMYSPPVGARHSQTPDVSPAFDAKKMAEKYPANSYHSVHNDVRLVIDSRTNELKTVSPRDLNGDFRK
uniref:Centrosomal protein of 164 kDa n=1 Tax=Phallusia mammillata TaxID=59560 RepID=A0A6F9D8G0_9ASCI|nr:centrosomal protein of 164 kDa-like [Phallusia mammillata]